MYMRLQHKLTSLKGIFRTIFTIKSLKLRVGMGILLTLIAISFLEPIITHCRLGNINPYEMGLFEKLLPPSLKHPLGTDHYGRDFLSIFLIGLKNSLVVGFLGGSLSILIAIVVSFFAAYKGGLADIILNSFTNTFLVIPSWVILASVAVYTPKLNIITVSLLIAVFNWAGAARNLRSQVLSLKERAYVDLAKVSGASDIEIIFKELMPNVLPYIIVGAANAVIGSIFFETSIGIIGLGATQYVSLGIIIYWFLTMGLIVQGYYNIILPPVIALVLIFVALNLINVGLDEIFNPRLKKITGL